MTKLKSLPPLHPLQMKGPAWPKIKDLEGQVELDAAFTFSCQAEMIIFLSYHCVR